MDAFFVPAGIGALAEIGDKTQLLALVLAARFRRPLPIVMGILVATLLNHALAGAVGQALTALLGPEVLRWCLGISFLLMAGWTLIPDKLDDEESELKGRWGVFGATLIAFFLAEMGDKTQLATIALAAQYANMLAVVAGTTVGMLLANVPVVYLGEKAAKAVPLRLVHGLAAMIFALLGLMILFQLDRLF